MNKITEINFEEINPYIRTARVHPIEKSIFSAIRYNRHYQFHYVFKGSVKFHIDKKDYIAKEHDFCIWGPGQKHTISTPYSETLVAGVQFDFTKNFSHLNYTLNPHSEESFKKEYIHEIVKLKDAYEIPSLLNIKEYKRAGELLKDTAYNFFQGDKYSIEIASCRLKEFFILIEKELSGKNIDENNIKKTNKILKYISENYKKNLDNKYLALKFGYHPVHLNRIIKKLTGRSLHQYLIKLRINEALYLLQNTKLSISEIASKVGYSNPAYFSRLFKSKTDSAPSDFRK